jgi:hypothetical protein
MKNLTEKTCQQDLLSESEKPMDLFSCSSVVHFSKATTICNCHSALVCRQFMLIINSSFFLCMKPNIIYRGLGSHQLPSEGVGISSSTDAFSQESTPPDTSIGPRIYERLMRMRRDEVFPDPDELDPDIQRPEYSPWLPLEDLTKHTIKAPDKILNGGDPIPHTRQQIDEFNRRYGI